MDLSYETTLPAVLARSASLYGSRTALAAIGGKSYTYAELLASVDAARARLTALGVAPGDRVAILSENRPEWGIAYFAILAHGAIAVPILSDFPPAETQNILRHSESSAAFVSTRLHPKIEGADLPLLRGIVAIEVLAELETRPIDEVVRTFA